MARFQLSVEIGEMTCYGDVNSRSTCEAMATTKVAPRNTITTRPNIKKPRHGACLGRDVLFGRDRKNPAPSWGKSNPLRATWFLPLSPRERGPGGEVCGRYRPATSRL